MSSAMKESERKREQARQAKVRRQMAEAAAQNVPSRSSLPIRGKQVRSLVAGYEGAGAGAAAAAAGGQPVKTISTIPGPNADQETVREVTRRSKVVPSLRYQSTARQNTGGVLFRATATAVENDRDTGLPVQITTTKTRSPGRNAGEDILEEVEEKTYIRPVCAPRSQLRPPGSRLRPPNQWQNPQASTASEPTAMTPGMRYLKQNRGNVAGLVKAAETQPIASPQNLFSRSPSRSPSKSGSRSSRSPSRSPSKSGSRSSRSPSRSPSKSGSRSSKSPSRSPSKSGSRSSKSPSRSPSKSGSRSPSKSSHQLEQSAIAGPSKSSQLPSQSGTARSSRSTARASQRGGARSTKSSQPSYQQSQKGKARSSKSSHRPSRKGSLRSTKSSHRPLQRDTARYSQSTHKSQQDEEQRSRSASRSPDRNTSSYDQYYGDATQNATTSTPIESVHDGSHKPVKSPEKSVGKSQSEYRTPTGDTKAPRMADIQSRKHMFDLNAKKEGAASGPSSETRGDKKRDASSGALLNTSLQPKVIRTSLTGTPRSGPSLPGDKQSLAAVKAKALRDALAEKRKIKEMNKNIPLKLVFIFKHEVTGHSYYSLSRDAAN